MNELEKLFATVIVFLFGLIVMRKTGSHSESRLRIVALLAISLLWISLPVSAQEHNVLSPVETKEGWKLLFNGKDISNWHRYGAPRKPIEGWSVTEGELVRKTNGKIHIVEQGDYADFELVLDWKVESQVNCGINLRVMESKGVPWEEAVKYQVSSKDLSVIEKKGPTFLSGGHHQKYAPISGDVSKPHGQWNTTRIFVKGKRYVFYLNEIKTLDFIMTDDFIPKWPDLGKNTHGHIGLQDHPPQYTRVWFRNIKIRPITNDKNQPPRVHIMNSRNHFESGSEVLVDVRGLDIEGDVAISLFDGKDRLGVSTTSPLLFRWKDASAGHHLIRAVATDSAGAVAEDECDVIIGDTNKVR